MKLQLQQKKKTLTLEPNRCTLKTGFKRQYFAIHAFANAVITALTWRGAMETLLNPGKSVYVWMPNKPASQLYLGE